MESDRRYTRQYITVGTHAAPVILLLVADAVSFLIEGVVLRLGDRYLFAGAANVDEIGLFFCCHKISSCDLLFGEQSQRGNSWLVHQKFIAVY